MQKIFTQLVVATLYCLLSLATSAQVYLVENFDGLFSSTPTSPAAPAGWQQTRFQAVPTANFERDWRQNVWLGSNWLLFNNGTSISGAVSGSGVLNIDMWNLGGSQYPLTERRIESPVMDLSASTSPYVRFFYFCFTDPGRAMFTRVVISSDGGQTWHTLSNVLNGTHFTNWAWNQINVPIPPKHRTNQVRIGFAVTNRSSSSNVFIDSLVVEEFTPTTITSQGNGEWHNATTWAGGVVPNSQHNVVIGAGHTVTTSNINNTITRCQDLTINGTLSAGSTTTNLLHVQSNLTVNGTLNSFLGNSGRILILGGNLTVNAGATMNFNALQTTQYFTLWNTFTPPVQFPINVAGIIFNNGGPVTVTNNSGAQIQVPNMIFTGSDTVTFAGTTNCATFRTVALYDGLVNPTNRLTVGNSPATNTQLSVIVGRGRFVVEPTWGNNTNQRHVAFTPVNMISVEPIQQEFNFCAPTVSGARQFNSLRVNTHNVVLLKEHTSFAGPLQWVRGIIKSTPGAYFWYTGTAANIGTPIEPSRLTLPNNHGSYVEGPIRVTFQAVNANYTLPLGTGSSFNDQNNIGMNKLSRLTVSPGANFAPNTSVIFAPIRSMATGAVNTPANSLMPASGYRLQRIGTPDLPATTTLTFEVGNAGFEVLGNAQKFANTTDSLQGLQNQLRIVRSTSATGAWNVISNQQLSAQIFQPNTTYNYNTTALGTNPLSTQGEFFTFASTAPPIEYDTNVVVRDTTNFSGVTPLTDVQILRVNIRGNGTVTRDKVERLVFTTAGTTNIPPITGAKVLYTRNNPVLAGTAVQFGARISNPVDTMVFNDNFYLLNGDNYFWLVYDVNGNHISGDSLAAQPVSAIVGGQNRLLQVPPPGFREAVAPMVFLSATCEHTNFDQVETQSRHNEILRMRVIMTSLGSSVQLSTLSLNNSASTSPFVDIDSTTIWFTGNNPEFVNPQYAGGTGPTFNNFTVPTAINLLNDTNYIWVTYNIPFFAGIGNVVDAAITGMNIGGFSRTPTVGNPPGNRGIRAKYCESGASDSNDTDIGRIVLHDAGDTLMNVGQGCGPFQAWAKGTYTNNTFIQGIKIPKGRTISGNVCNASSSLLFPAYLAIFIDFNRDGVWDSVEMVWSADTSLTQGHSFQFVIPCDVDTGLMRMRFVLQENALPLTFEDACTPYSFGETEDYTIRIIDFTPQFVSATAVQQTGLFPPNTSDVPVLKLPVSIKSSVCDPAIATSFYFSTQGTSNNADLAAAKIFKTTTPVFNPNKLLAKIDTPSGQFVFNIVDTTNNGFNYYWLAYDIDSNANANNLIDATFDSVVVDGHTYTPIVSNPTGNVVIEAPMSYISSTTIHTDFTRIERGTNNNVMMRARVIMSSTGATVQATQFALNLTGSNNPNNNIDSIYVWYTGASDSLLQPTLFAASGKQSGPFNINGFQNLLNDTNYFWITFLVSPTANIGDTADIVLNHIFIDGIARIPTDTAPAGSRVIKDKYCGTSAIFSDDAAILKVSIGALDNLSNCTTVAPGAGSILNRYANYTLLTPATVVAGKPVSFSVNPRTCDGNFTAMLGIWIDLNDDGDFIDPGELVYQSPTVFSYNPFTTVSGSIVIPCPPFEGNKRLRVSMIETSTLTNLSPCGLYAYGETEDYLINVITMPSQWDFATTEQLTDTAEAATTNNPILIMSVKADANLCQVGLVSQMNFSTTGTTQLSDIVSAKVFKTSTPMFDTSRLIGQTNNIAAQVSISLSDTLGLDTIYYWLAFDVAPTATNNNFLDASLDSILFNGSWFAPTVGNPNGAVRVYTFMKFIAADATHPVIKNPEQGQTGVKMLQIPIEMTNIGQPIDLTQLQLSVLGTNNPLSNIDSIFVWYTANDSTFTAPILFASTGSQAGSYVLSGSQSLAFGVNYLWVTYNLKSTANIGDTIDAELLSLTIGGQTVTPNTTSPTGFRIIRPFYCAPTYVNGTGSGVFISAVQLNDLQYAGTSSSAPFYSFIDTLSATLNMGGFYTIGITGGSQNNNSIAAWIDFNGDGIFTADEKIGEATLVAQSPFTQQFNFYLPLQSAPLFSRLRVIIHDSTGVGFMPCATYTNGEAKDFMLNLLPVPTPTTYMWQGGVDSLFTNPLNWVPQRQAINLSDRLLFNSNQAFITQVQAQRVAVLQVNANSHVHWQGATLQITDTFALQGMVSTVGSTAISIGELSSQGVKKGTVTGNGVVNGTVERWIDTTTGIYLFPVGANDTLRAATILFNTPPLSIAKIQVQFVSQSPGLLGLPYTDNSITINKTAEDGYWSITPITSISGGNYQLTLQGNGFRGINNLNSLVISQRNDALASWTPQGNAMVAGGTLSQPEARRNNLSIWGQFTIASDSAINPLPVTWLGFNAKIMHLDAQLTWKVSDEIAGEWYEVQRSSDGVNFETLHSILISRNRRGINSYVYTDKNVFEKRHEVYYRIANYSPDGSAVFSTITRLAGEVNNLLNAQILPNPFSTELIVNIRITEIGAGTLTVENTLGISMVQMPIYLSNKNETITINGVEAWPAGVYYITINHQGERRVIKAVKHE
jgi:hypothetical protein